MKSVSPTAIVMLNLGGPASLQDVEPFLIKLFSDWEILSLPFQRGLGRLIALIRAPQVRARYAEIGGGSPLHHWTQLQGEGLVSRLDRLSPQTAPHSYYIAFRYSEPSIEQAFMQMKADGVKRAVAFSQYPHFSSTTTGASLNELQRVLAALQWQDEFQWSVIDRWSGHPGYIHAVADSIHAGLMSLPEQERAGTLILFSAHSLPMKVVDRGDPYPEEIRASALAVMQHVNVSNDWLISYQSKAGPVRWLEPSTARVIRALGQHKRRSVLVVPFGFTSDHIETLYEIDIEYRQLSIHAGIPFFQRAPSLNNEAAFLDALSDIAANHLRHGSQESLIGLSF